MAGAKINIGADIADYVDKVKQIPNITEKEAEKAGKALRQKMINEAIRGIVDVEKKEKEAAKEREKAAKEFQDQLLDMGELAGVPGDQIKKLRSGIGALASPIGVAVVGLGGAAVAVGALGAGIVASVAAADDLARSLGKIKGLSSQEGFGVSKADLASLESANAAMSSLTTIGEQAVVTLGAEFAPAVEQVAIELVKLGLVGLDAFNAFADGGNVLKQLAEFLVGRLVKAITKPADKLADLAYMLGKVAKAAGADGLARDLALVNKAYEGMVAEFSSLPVEGVAASFEHLGALTGEYDDRARALIGTIKRHEAAQRSSTDSVKDAEKAAREAAEAEERRRQAIEGLIAEYGRIEDAQQDATRGGVARAEREIQAVDDLMVKLWASGELTAEREQTLNDRKAQIAAEYVSKVITEEQRLEAERVRLHAAELQRISALRDARVSAATSAANQLIAGIDALADYEYQQRTTAAKDIEEQLADTEADLTEAQRAELESRLALEKKQAKRSFNLSKALSLAQIVMSTSEAGMAAFAQGMKLGGPIGAALLLATALAVGGLQAGLVAKQKPPAHRGLTPVGGAAADEGMTMLTAGEAVLSPRGVEAAGGPGGVSAMNAGGAMGGATTVNLNLGLRTLDTITAQTVNRPGATRAAMRKNNPVGQRSTKRGN